ncbi:MAG: M12 family metallo-peptidase [Planctomycetota bacterium]
MPRIPIHPALPLLALAPVAAAQVDLQPAPEGVLAAFDQGAGLLQTLDLPAAPTEPFQVEIFLDGAPHTVHFAPFSLRSDEFEVRVQQADGSWVVADPTPPATVRGIVQGFPESWVAGSLVDGELSAIARLHAGDTMWGIQSVSQVDATAPRGLHLLFDEADSQLPAALCGTPAVQAPRQGELGTPGPDGGSGSKYTEISCDADVQYYNQNGSSVTATTNDIENIINGCDAIYDSDFNVRYEIGTILVRTSEPDPYSTSSASPLLNQFKSEWIANQVGIKRDVAHLFTGKNIVGSTIGIAYLNGVCSVSSGYGLSQSKWTGSLTARIALTAHELGHNWGANHCNGTSDCKIMCSGLGGCSGILTSFGSSASAEISLKKSIATCLTGPPPTVAPTLFSASPSTVGAFGSAPITVSGVELEWVESVTVGGQSLPSPGGFLVLGENELYITVSDPPSLGTVPLVATNPIGASNPVNITFTEQSPPALVNSFWAITETDYEWKFGGGPGDLWFLNIAVNDLTTAPFLGFDFLLNTVQAASGVLGAAGVESFEINLLPTAVGLTFYSQVVTVDGSGAVEPPTNVTTSFVLL